MAASPAWPARHAPAAAHALPCPFLAPLCALLLPASALQVGLVHRTDVISPDALMSLAAAALGYSLLTFGADTKNDGECGGFSDFFCNFHHFADRGPDPFPRIPAYARTHARTLARTHARTHARTRLLAHCSSRPFRRFICV